MWDLKKLTALMVLAVALCGSSVATAFNAKHLMKLKVRNVCERCDLRGADLRKSGLRNANLIKADLRRADLRGTNLSKADLRYAKFEWANLSGAYLKKANLSAADLSGADLSTAILKGTKHDGAILCKTLMPWGEENTGCRDALRHKPIVETPKTEKSAAKYKVCKKTCADDFMVCIVDKPNIEPEACTETANQCLYSCKDKFQ